MEGSHARFLSGRSEIFSGQHDIFGGGAQIKILLNIVLLRSPAVFIAYWQWPGSWPSLILKMYSTAFIAGF
jgi:hypothetical protein